MRKTIVAMFALAAVGLVQPTVVSAHGGGFGGGGGYPPPPRALAATMRKEAAIATWLRIASRRTTAGEYDEFRSAVSRRQ